MILRSKYSERRATKLHTVQTVKITKWENIHDYRKGDWIFRGMKDSRWAMETALERNGWIREGGLSKLKKRERTLLREFQRRYYHYSSHVPLRDDTLEWLSIMQNHGAPTRLLDWSYSIYVAAYFALEEAETDCAVWALNTKWIFKELRRQYKDSERQKFLTNPIQNTLKHRRLFKDIFITNQSNQSVVAAFSPFRMNERLTIQKGTSVVPSNLSIGFEDNLSAMPGYEKASNLMRLVIPITLRKIAIQSLFYMNISRATLFPGLDGFSSSLGIYLPTLDAIDGSS
jgi:FRG domain-containing protein